MASIVSEKQDYNALHQLDNLHATTGSLRHTTSKDTTRYDGTAQVRPAHTLVTEEFARSRDAVPPYLPPHWSAHTHPEGQLYFYCHSVPHIVTEAYLYHPGVMAKVTFWSDVIRDLLQKRTTLSDDVELFLQIDGNDCAYYFIDHANRTEFWLEAYTTEDLNISPVISPSHLKLALEELYWKHIEHFPMHIGGLQPHILEELIAVFSHALADRMTSRYSTFPYSAPECTKFLKLLNTSRDRINDGHTTCLVARLWNLVFIHRFSTYYGQEHARLSRDQVILADSAQESSWMAAMTSLLSFRTSDTYVLHLNELFIDHLVYVDQWKPFMSTCLRNWRRMSHLAFLSLMLHIFVVFVPSSLLLTVISASCLGSSIVSSTLLVHRHEELESATATQALIYLDALRSYKFKFQLVAFVYSLPTALYLWGLLAFVLNWFVIATGRMGTGLGAGLLCLFLLAVLAFQRTTSQTAGNDFLVGRLCSRLFVLNRGTAVPEVSHC